MAIKHSYSKIIYLTILGLCTLTANKAWADNGLNGIWQTTGYGFLFQIEDKNVTIFETTKISCYPSILSAGPLSVITRQPINEKVAATFPVSVPGFIDATIEVRHGDSDNTKSFFRTDTGAPMTATRISALPARCTQAISNNAVNTFDIFTAIFDEHYPFFDTFDIQWDKEDARSKAINISDDNSLFDLLLSLIEPLRDPHIILAAPALEKFYFGNEHLRRKPAYFDNKQLVGNFDYGTKLLLQNIETNYAANPLVYSCDNQFAVGEFAAGDIVDTNVNAAIGYLKINSFGDCAGNLNTILDTIIHSLSGKGALILDLRSNLGGSDKAALTVLSRFTDVVHHAYSKQVAVDYASQHRWTQPRPVFVSVSTGPSFRGTIVLLTDAGTLSAGETFTMGLKNRHPQIIHMGEATAGAFSDILPRVLPNGFLLGLPNERFINKNGNSFDSSGIQPDLLVRFNINDFKQGADSQLEAAIKAIAAKAQ